MLIHDAITVLNIDETQTVTDAGTEDIYCNATWDRILCWPATPANTTIKLPCPPWFNGLDKTSECNVIKHCVFLIRSWYKIEKIKRNKLAIASSRTHILIFWAHHLGLCVLPLPQQSLSDSYLMRHCMRADDNWYDVIPCDVMATRRVLMNRHYIEFRNKFFY